MLKLSNSFKKFLDTREIENDENAQGDDYHRISANELKIGKVIHKLQPVECDHCSGEGKHLYGSMKGHAYTQEEMDEDPDFREDMMEGKYDVSCQECDGQGFVMIPCEEDPINADLLEEWYNDARIRSECDAEVEAERRYMYGGDY